VNCDAYLVYELVHVCQRDGSGFPPKLCMGIVTVDVAGSNIVFRYFFLVCFGLISPASLLSIVSLVSATWHNIELLVICISHGQITLYRITIVDITYGVVGLERQPRNWR